MKIRYLDQDGPEKTSTQGYDFARGEWVEVTDPIAIARLSRNPYFEVARQSESEAPVETPVAPVIKKRGRPSKVSA